MFLPIKSRLDWVVQPETKEALAFDSDYLALLYVLFVHILLLAKVNMPNEIQILTKLAENFLVQLANLFLRTIMSFGVATLTIELTCK